MSQYGKRRSIHDLTEAEWMAWQAGEDVGPLEADELDEQALAELNYDTEQEEHEMLDKIVGSLGWARQAPNSPTTPTTSTIPQTTTYKACGHTGLGTCLTITTASGKTFELAGGSGSYTQSDEHSRLIVDLAGHVDVGRWVVSGPQALVGKLQWAAIEGVPILRLDWDDREAPAPPQEWWYRFVHAIDEMYKPGRITFACMGGHGRTGTAIACTALAASADMRAQDAIDWVRTNHCKRAIETVEQMLYIYDMRPDEEISDTHNAEMFPPTKPIAAVSNGTTPTPFVHTACGYSGCTKSIYHTGEHNKGDGCTWNTWCAKKVDHKGRCRLTA